MTNALRDALHQVADGSPSVPVPSGLFDRARRDRLRHRLTGLAAAALALSSIGLAAQIALPPTPAATDTTVDPLPAHIVHAPAWTADIRHAPLRRALVAFDNDGFDIGYTVDMERGESVPHPIGPLTLVGPDDAYRAYDLSDAGDHWDGTVELSPDGRYVMTGHGQHTRLLDVATGDARTLEAGTPLAFSPDSRQAVLVSWDNPSYLHPVRGAINVVDLPSGAVAWSAPLADGPLPREVQAALSPDGSTLIVQRRGDLYTYGREHGVGWTRSLSMTGGIAGQLAWTPDGRSIAVDMMDLCLLDADTGVTGRCLQWQAMLTRMPEREQTFAKPIILDWADGAPIVTMGRDVVRLTEVAEILMRTPRTDTVGALTVASSRVQWTPRQPGPPDPGPLVHRYRPLLVGAGWAIAVLALGYILIRLRRRRAPSDRRDTAQQG
ncbi:WD40 repeat domain-containing protein [Catellatospora sichuanensis]|uniref:WD40 repeat domain-containing protein n=1 Tax=Catellatospora sichuanensis TaxID=1969805 RepID=UPI0011839CBF|nr:hypothetical protein [Catellatospora sichuanensis]